MAPTSRWFKLNSAVSSFRALLIAHNSVHNILHNNDSRTSIDLQRPTCIENHVLCNLQPDSERHVAWHSKEDSLAIAEVADVTVWVDWKYYPHGKKFLGWYDDVSDIPLTFPCLPAQLYRGLIQFLALLGHSKLCGITPGATKVHVILRSFVVLTWTCDSIKLV